MIRLAIFADIHGKFLLPFKLANHYQTLTGKKIDYIVQCGDMGAFPNKNTMDKATLRHAQNDPDELGLLWCVVRTYRHLIYTYRTINLIRFCRGVLHTPFGGVYNGRAQHAPTQK